MADTGIFCSGSEVLFKAGANYNLSGATEAILNNFMTQAESFINVSSNYNFSDRYTALNADVKGVLKEAASDLAAIYVINYDMSGYTSRMEAQTMLDVLRDRFVQCLDLLRKRDNVEFITKS